MKILLTCEHGGNVIPHGYTSLFRDGQAALNSHRGYDPGALDLFHYLKNLADYSYFSTTSRLLVELNRSIGHPKLFSEFTKSLSNKEKQHIMQKHYFLYRDEIEKVISREIARGEKLLHISVHTFTPVLNGEIRDTDIGLLFDPARALEKDFVRIWKFNMSKIAPSVKLRFNYPYLGRADGFTTYLRKKFPQNYMGIELEVNQSFCEGNKMAKKISNDLYLSLQQSL
ncbi:MAG TPA: N-formylglutamate amidohydrolase [Gillisia sp.]|nr:N-formylglutamate amidohydrolase [Gillisia sp.]